LAQAVNVLAESGNQCAESNYLEPIDITLCADMGKLSENVVEGRRLTTTAGAGVARGI
jgi:hypothetical protein